MFLCQLIYSTAVTSNWIFTFQSLKRISCIHFQTLNEKWAYLFRFHLSSKGYKYSVIFLETFLIFAPFITQRGNRYFGVHFNKYSVRVFPARKINCLHSTSASVNLFFWCKLRYVCSFFDQHNTILPFQANTKRAVGLVNDSGFLRHI